MSANKTVVGAEGIIAEFPGYGITHAAGTSVPADNTRGYAPGCIFTKVNSTNPDYVIYLNVGTNLLCNFDSFHDVFGV